MPGPIDDLLPELPPEFDRVYTAAEFLDLRPRLPEQGQWAELVDGRVQLRFAPEVEHGDIVGNLMTRLSAAVGADPLAGMPLFRKPVQTAARTVRLPAMVWLSEGGFAAMDADILTTAPDWLVEIAGPTALRGELPDRIRGYTAWGVRLLWLIDPAAQQVVRLQNGEAATFESSDTIAADPVLPQFRMDVADLFRQPELWTRPTVVPSDDLDARDAAAMRDDTAISPDSPSSAG